MRRSVVTNWTRHLEYQGRPICGASPDGSFLVDIWRPRDSDCWRCHRALQAMTQDRKATEFDA